MLAPQKTSQTLLAIPTRVTTVNPRDFYTRALGVEIACAPRGAGARRVLVEAGYEVRPPTVRPACVARR